MNIKSVVALVVSTNMASTVLALEPVSGESAPVVSENGDFDAEALEAKLDAIAKLEEQLAG